MLSRTSSNNNRTSQWKLLEPPPCLMSMDIFLQDLRYAARKLLRAPAFTVVAVSTLALAIGATTAVYSIVDGVILKPLPFRAPEQLVRLESTDRQGKSFPLSPADYLDYTSQTTSFSGLAQFGVGSANFSSTSEGEPSRLDRANVGPALLRRAGCSAGARSILRRGRRRPGIGQCRRDLRQALAQPLWRKCQRPRVHRSRSTSARTPSSAWRRAR